MDARSADSDRNLKSYFARQLRRRMTELGISATGLAAEIGVSRSLLSAYLSDSKTMPTTRNLVRLSKALRVDPAYFLLLPSEGSYDEATARIVNGGQAMMLGDQLKALMKEVSSRPDRIFHYLPSSLPEPLKTNAVLRAEYGESFDIDMQTYRNYLQDMIGLQIFGNVLLDRVHLLDLIERRGRYAQLTRSEANEQVELIANYADQTFPHLQMRVTDYFEARLNPCLALGDDIVSIEFFGRTRHLSKGWLVAEIIESIKRALFTAETIQTWLPHHWPR